LNKLKPLLREKKIIIKTSSFIIPYAWSFICLCFRKQFVIWKMTKFFVVSFHFKFFKSARPQSKNIISGSLNKIEYKRKRNSIRNRIIHKIHLRYNLNWLTCSKKIFLLEKECSFLSDYCFQKSRFQHFSNFWLISKQTIIIKNKRNKNNQFY